MAMTPIQEAGVGKLVFGIILMVIVLGAAFGSGGHGGILWVGGAIWGLSQVIFGLIQISTGKHPHEVDKKLW